MLAFCHLFSVPLFILFAFCPCFLYLFVFCSSMLVLVVAHYYCMSIIIFFNYYVIVCQLFLLPLSSRMGKSAYCAVLDLTYGFSHNGTDSMTFLR